LWSHHHFHLGTWNMGVCGAIKKFVWRHDKGLRNLEWVTSAKSEDWDTNSGTTIDAIRRPEDWLSKIWFHHHCQWKTWRMTQKTWNHQCRLTPWKMMAFLMNRKKLVQNTHVTPWPAPDKEHYPHPQVKVISCISVPPKEFVLVCPSPLRCVRMMVSRTGLVIFLTYTLYELFQ